MDKLESLLQKVHYLIEMDKQRKEESRKRGERFNIFSVLGLETSEVRTHSAFLASLLNPNGDHGVSKVFLDAFVNAMHYEELQLNTKESSVDVEYDTGNGRIDILISDNNKKAIIIENKIYAGDQPEQMKRYYDYAKSEFTNGFRLLYLTLDGHNPSKESTDELQTNQFNRLAYRNTFPLNEETQLESQELAKDGNLVDNDILIWLEECVKIAYDKPLVRETIIQYIQLIKSLTGMNSDTETKQQLISLLAKKENYEVAALIAENFLEIKKKVVYKYLKPQLEDRIKSLNKELRNASVLTIKEFIYGEGNESSGITISVSAWKNGEIGFEFEKYDGTDILEYGVVDISGNKSLHSISWEGFKHNDRWPAYKRFPYYWWGIDTIKDIFSGKVADAFMKSIKELLEINEKQGFVL